MHCAKSEYEQTIRKAFFTLRSQNKTNFHHDSCNLVRAFLSDLCKTPLMDKKYHTKLAVFVFPIKSVQFDNEEQIILSW